MTDSTLPPANPNSGAAPAPSSAPQSNPLDALEAILQQAKTKPAGGTPGVAPAPAASTQLDAAAVAAAEAQKEAELAALEATQKAGDAVQVQAKLADLQQVTQSPEYHARVEQDAAQQQAHATQQHDQAEFEIHQLGHTKI